MLCISKDSILQRSRFNNTKVSIRVRSLAAQSISDGDDTEAEHVYVCC